MVINVHEVSAVDGEIQKTSTKRAPTSFNLVTFMKISMGSEVHLLNVITFMLLFLTSSTAVTSIDLYLTCE